MSLAYWIKLKEDRRAVSMTDGETELMAVVIATNVKLDAVAFAR